MTGQRNPEFVRILKRAAIRPEARTKAFRMLQNTSTATC